MLAIFVVKKMLFNSWFYVILFSINLITLGKSLIVSIT
jgi:hypothetical protein